MKYIVIGGGPAGMEAAVTAQKNGHETILIEKDFIGGTCLNRGCIPTKALLELSRKALELKKIQDEHEFIVQKSLELNYSYISDRLKEIIGKLRLGAQTVLEGVRIIKSEATIIDAHTVKVDDELLTADRVIIATGSRPAVPPFPGAASALTSDDILTWTHQWNEDNNSFIIIGGGVIGIEFATIFNALYPNSAVTIIESMKEILPGFDAEVAKKLKIYLTKKGIKFLTDASVEEILGNKVLYKQKGVSKTIEADRIIIATGRKPVLPEGIENLKINISRRGIEVDSDYRTSHPDIYAIGDVNGECMLAHAASAQARKIMGCDINISVIPSVVFSIPECAMVGLTEQQCEEKNIPYNIRKAFFRGNGKALCMDMSDGFVKVIINPEDNHLIGAHVIGPHAADIIAEFTLAMANDLDIKNILSTVHAHPTLNEIIITVLNE